ncbi:AsmA family protein [Halomonas binhaiensis]|uniref:AsmA family protein n=1 Tax=Halomonas binhaiensis TaxID=2562282 RepID=A0A5C1NEP7_9GAMM|nr:AsmA family protein [Halomonas binhaiensis]QEM80179.1 AsmA family protein [Halomonas binhaiensis]
MKRLLRTLLAVVGVLALVAVGAVVYVSTFFDLNDLKPRLVELVEEHSGLELELDGPLNWSFYPRLGVSVSQAEAWLPQQPDQAAPFAAIDHASVSLAFAPLLKGVVAVDGLTLDGLSLNLKRDEQGNGNWETLLERLEGKGEGAEKALAPASAGPSFSSGRFSVALNIASVDVLNGTLRLADAKTGRDWLAEDLKVNGTNVNPTSAFPVTSSFVLKSFDQGAKGQQQEGQQEGQKQGEQENGSPLLESSVKLTGQVALGLVDKRYALTDFSLQTDTLLEGDSASQKATLVGNKLVLDLNQQRLLLRGGVLDGSVLDPRLGEKPVDLSLAFQLESDLAEDTAQLRDMALTGPDGLSLRGNLNVADLTGEPSYDGQLRLAPMSLRPWLTRMNALPDMASSDALSEVALTSPVKGSVDEMTLKGLTLVLDDQTFSGNLAARFDGGSLSVDLEGEGLDLDSYLPPADESQGEATASIPGISAAIAQDETSAILPAEWLAKVEEDVDLALGKLILGGQTYEDVILKTQGKDGKHRLTQFDADFHEGKLQATGELDATDKPLKWKLVPKVQGVRLAPLLVSLGEDPAPLAGRLDAEGEFTSRGNASHELVRHLNGTLKTQIKEGSIPRANISRQLCSAVASLEGESTTREWSENTRFEDISATFDIRDGVAHNEDLLITLPGIEMSGQGQLDLGSRVFEATGAGHFVDTADAACSVNPRLTKLEFPVRCEGTLGTDSNEWCSFDTDAFRHNLGRLAGDEAKGEAQEKLEERLDKELEKLDERIGDDASKELRDAVRGLFN